MYSGPRKDCKTELRMASVENPALGAARVHGTKKLTSRAGVVGTYVGSLLDGEADGVGTWTTEDEVYDGEWKKNERTGRGSVKYANGNEYYGGWKDGKMHGKGRCTWASGHVYTGEYIDDKMHGRGTFKWFDGDRYDGEYKDNKKNGRGSLKWADGRIWNGPWELDSFKGKASKKAAA